MSDSAPDEAASAPGRKTIGSVAFEAIREGLTNEQALERVLAEFPHARTTKASIGKYRRMLWSKGEDVPTAAELRAKQPVAPASQKLERNTVGSVAMDAIREGRTTKQIVAIVKEQFPEARISESSVNSYRSRLRSRGEAVPTAREASAAAADGFDLLVADLEVARAVRAAMATKADLAVLETRLVRRIAGVAVAAVIAVAAAVKLLS